MLFYVIVIKATYNNVSAISWWSAFLMEENGETHRPPQVTDKLMLFFYFCKFSYLELELDKTDAIFKLIIS